jgi:hypothetical protein
MSLKRKLMRKKSKDALHKEIMNAFNFYKLQVPNVGRICIVQAEDLLEAGNICRGQIIENGKIDCFHIIKSPTCFPEKSIFRGETEFSLFQMLIIMGMEKGVDLYKMLSDD